MDSDGQNTIMNGDGQCNIRVYQLWVVGDGQYSIMGSDG